MKPTQNSMYRSMLKSKLHRATVTDANLAYEGSISIDPMLCEKAALLPFERVDVYNCNNGERFSTYVIRGRAGEICVNGAAARLVQAGDRVIIASFVDMPNEDCFSHEPQIVLLNEKNQVVSQGKV